MHKQFTVMLETCCICLSSIHTAVFVITLQVMVCLPPIIKLYSSCMHLYAIHLLFSQYMHQEMKWVLTVALFAALLQVGVQGHISDCCTCARRECSHLSFRECCNGTPLRCQKFISNECTECLSHCCTYVVYVT